ncbi:MFS transporter [Streptomyces sp. NPDC056503]|uniref:MFS transporter n=1 Tax=Streptomyces sp. NPDC056503 TaxID=3345842 RepID=UPI00369A4534
MTGTTTPLGAGAAPAPGGGHAVSPRVIGLVLALVAALYVVAPAMNAAVAPLVHTDLGVSAEDNAVAQVAGACLAIGVLAATGRAGDVRGRRATLSASLTALCLGSLALAVSFDPATYVLGRILVAVSLAAVFVSCLAFMTTVSMPGRIRRIMGGWLAAMSAGFVLAVNLAPHAAVLTGWRVTAALMALAAGAALVIVRRLLPETGALTREALPDAVRTACRVLCAVALAAALQLAPLWGWQDLRVGALLTAAVLACAAARLRALRRAPERGRSEQVPGAVWTGALVAGLALGFTQVVLTIAVPSLVSSVGLSTGIAALVLSAFGVGGAAACLLIRYRAVSPLAGASLGLPLAALGMALLHALLDHGSHALAGGFAVVTLIGFGTMLATAPQMARFLAAVPRPHLGVNAALLPSAILVGTAAAQALPYTSALDPMPLPTEARELLWVGTVVVAVAAFALGRPVVALAVTAASVLQYVMVDADTSQPMSVVVALAVGAAAGAVAWSRREQTERLTRTRETATALQCAVLHPIPSRLGALRLAGLYRPATAGTAIGGDFLEALDTPYGTRILIGDVRGKGLQAVQTVTDLLGCFRSQAHETEDLGEVAACLDRQVRRAALARGDEELFATALLLQHAGPSRDLHAVNCGHLAPLEVGPGGARELHVPAVLPLGFGLLDAAGAVRSHRVALDPGATLLTHTDGLSEARNSTGEFYPVAERLSAAGPRTPDALVRHLDDDVRDWTHHLADDIAVIAVGPR